MAIVINTNVSSLAAQKNLSANQSRLMTSFNRLSSGLRVNTAADDAAGLAISESMKAQIRSFTVAERNANDAISMAQTAEGALNEVHGILGRMRELAVQASNGSLTDTDRGYLNTEFGQLQGEVTRIQGSAKYNNQKLVNVTAATVKFQVGLDNTASDQISVTFGGLNLAAIASAGVGGVTAALTAIGRVDTAIGTVSTQRSKFGAAMNRLEVSTSNIQTQRLNLSAANSRIRDVDVASESAALSRNQVLSQAGVSVLAQANQLPQLAFGLLG
jgi:flagellin